MLSPGLRFPLLKFSLLFPERAIYAGTTPKVLEVQIAHGILSITSGKANLLEEHNINSLSKWRGICVVRKQNSLLFVFKSQGLTSIIRKFRLDFGAVDHFMAVIGVIEQLCIEISDLSTMSCGLLQGFSQDVNTCEPLSGQSQLASNNASMSVSGLVQAISPEVSNVAKIADLQTRNTGFPVKSVPPINNLETQAFATFPLTEYKLLHPAEFSQSESLLPQLLYFMISTNVTVYMAGSDMLLETQSLIAAWQHMHVVRIGICLLFTIWDPLTEEMLRKFRVMFECLDHCQNACNVLSLFVEIRDSENLMSVLEESSRSQLSLSPSRCMQMSLSDFSMLHNDVYVQPVMRAVCAQLTKLHGANLEFALVRHKVLFDPRHQYQGSHFPCTLKITPSRLIIYGAENVVFEEFTLIGAFSWLQAMYRRECLVFSFVDSVARTLRRKFRVRFVNQTQCNAACDVLTTYCNVSDVNTLDNGTNVDVVNVDFAESQECFTQAGRSCYLQDDLFASAPASQELLQLQESACPVPMELSHMSPLPTWHAVGSVELPSSEGSSNGGGSDCPVSSVECRSQLSSCAGEDLSTSGLSQISLTTDSIEPCITTTRNASNGTEFGLAFTHVAYQTSGISGVQKESECDYSVNDFWHGWDFNDPIGLPPNGVRTEVHQPIANHVNNRTPMMTMTCTVTVTDGHWLVTSTDSGKILEDHLLVGAYRNVRIHRRSATTLSVSSLADPEAVDVSCDNKWREFTLCFQQEAECSILCEVLSRFLTVKNASMEDGSKVAAAGSDVDMRFVSQPALIEVGEVTAGHLTHKPVSYPYLTMPVSPKVFNEEAVAIDLSPVAMESNREALQQAQKLASVSTQTDATRHPVTRETATSPVSMKISDLRPAVVASRLPCPLRQNWRQNDRCVRAVRSIVSIMSPAGISAFVQTLREDEGLYEFVEGLVLVGWPPH